MQATAAQLRPGDTQRTGELALVVSEVFSGPVPAVAITSPGQPAAVGRLPAGDGPAFSGIPAQILPGGMPEVARGYSGGRSSRSL